MINSKELRRGNYVNFEPNGGTDYCIVNAIDTTELRLATVDGQFKNIVAYLDSGWLNPIPLTPEILEACGNISPIELIYDDSDAPGIVGDYRFKFNDEWVIIEYLHHLQNLYQDIAKKEFEIKEFNNMHTHSSNHENKS